MKVFACIIIILLLITAPFTAPILDSYNQKKLAEKMAEKAAKRNVYKPDGEVDWDKAAKLLSEDYDRKHKKTVKSVLVSAASSVNDVRRKNIPKLPPKNNEEPLPENIDWNEVNEVINKSVDELFKRNQFRHFRTALNNTATGKYDIQMTETTRQVIRCLNMDIGYICSHAPEYEKNTAHLEFLKHKYTGLDRKLIDWFGGQFIVDNFVF